jgi:hypothetical protein
LGYAVDGTPNAVYYTVPGYHNSNQYYVASWMNVGVFHMRSQVYNTTSQSWNTFLTPVNPSSAKIMIIESTNVTTVSGNGKAVTPKQKILDELQVAGVNVNNYLDVCAYYGVQP